MAKSVFPVGMTVWLFCAIPAAIAAPDAITRTASPETATIHVAVEQAYPPYSFVGEDGRATGFSVDLARAIAETMGLTVEIKIAPWGRIRDDLTEGKLDLIAGMYYSDERSRTVAFSPPYTVTHHAIFARKQSPPVASEADLRGKSLIVMRGDIMHDYVVANGLSDDVVVTQTQADALRLLASGRHDYALLARLPGLYFVEQLGLSDIVTTGPLLCPSDYCFATRRQNDRLIETFGEGLAILKKTGRYREIYDRWLGVYEPHSEWAYTVVKYLGPAVIVILLLLVAAVGFSRRAHRRLEQRVRERTADLAAANRGLRDQIRERRQAEEALQQANAQLQMILDEMIDGLLITDIETKRLMRVNASLCRMFGYSEEEMLRRSIKDLHPAPAVDEDLRRFEAAAEGRVTLNENRPTLRNDGSIFYADISGRRILYRGRPCLLALFRDITERKRAEESLRASEDKYRAYIDNSPMAIFVIDGAGGGVEVNRAACELVGYAEDELKTMSFGNLLAPEEIPRGTEAIRELLRTGRARSGEVRYFRKDGTEGFMSIHAVRHALDRVIAFCADVSERKQAEIDLRRAMLAAEDANRAKSEFLANMSHEIRTPMTAILGFAEMLLGSPSREEVVQSAETIMRNGEHLLQIINDILDLSKIEAGKQEIEPMTCSPRQIAADVLDTMKVRAEAKGLPLALEIGPDLPERIRTDCLRLRQILVNLVGNAIKFTEVGGVRLAVHGDPDDRPTVRFDVIDTGIGMSPEQIAGLFQPFSQADGSAHRCYGGTGLGLAISKRLAAMLGGDIALASEPGRGSTFSLTIAAGSPDDTGPVPADNACGEPTAPPDDVPDGAPERLDCRVLLAEDGPDNQILIAHLLRSAGAAVTVAENGQIALDLALAARRSGQAYDVIVMDIQMPVMDGCQATRRLRSAGYRGPIVALTAHAMTSDRQKCLEAGCDDYTTKPIHRAALLACLAKYARVCEKG
ncbi:MAG: transporter substrate-binding domain-containing protein [Planctomycetia bacterium]|nr:transporter substrate-binding domain-containing protein [Planctomycetia bacterium]